MKFLALLFGLMLGFALNGWIFMLLIGAVHSFVPVVPALSFGASVIATIALAFVGSFFKGNK